MNHDRDNDISCTLSRCWSSVGKTRKSYQRISLGRGCGSKGIAIHELMHALGFWHEQSRYDRDSYVRIHWENIKKGKAMV